MTNIFLISIILISLAFIGIAIKILLKKDGQFAGTCASKNALINNTEEECSLCGAMPSEQCQEK